MTRLPLHPHLPMSARIRRWFEERGLPPPWFARSRHEVPDWESLLEGDNRHSILDRLAEDDPLDLGAMSILVLSDEARLVHPDRLTARLCAQIALLRVLGDAVEPDLATWLRKTAENCLRDLIEEDAHDERRRIPLTPHELHEFAEIVPPESGIEPQQRRLATTVFNAFPLEERVPFYRCSIEGFPLEHISEERGESSERLLQRIHATMDKLEREIARRSQQRRR